MAGKTADITFQCPYGRHHRRDLVSINSRQLTPYKLLLSVYDTTDLGIGSIIYVLLGGREGLPGRRQLFRDTLPLLHQAVHMRLALTELLLGPRE